MSLHVNEFQVRVASPEDVRTSLEVGEDFVKANTEPQVSMLMMQRYLFIEDAIREKLEREKEKP